jgi:DNA-binding MarR family transcriptional regulator
VLELFGGRSVQAESSQPICQAVALLPRLWRLLPATMGGAYPLKQLSMSQLEALRFLNSAPGSTLTELAAELRLSLGAASESVDRLVDLDLVERGVNPENRRQVSLSLTPRACAMACEIRDRRFAQLQEVFARLSPEEGAAFVKGLAALVDVLAASTGGTADRPGRAVEQAAQGGQPQ